MEHMLLFLAIIAAGTGGVRHCAPASIGPGSLHRGGTAGATCLLSSFQNGCRAADYTLSSFGVDTVRARKFQVERRNGRCAVLVTDTNRVVPQPPRVLARRTCSRVHRLNGDMVADRCTPRETISLTKIG
ncbi:MAG TPA: hypothetical protein VFW41_07370 [Gaiellaceae bacterium]|nr:hypothetical protein [Gaiellaceae bacterium]